MHYVCMHVGRCADEDVRAHAHLRRRQGRDVGLAQVANDLDPGGAAEEETLCGRVDEPDGGQDGLSSQARRRQLRKATYRVRCPGQLSLLAETSGAVARAASTADLCGRQHSRLQIRGKAWLVRNAHIHAYECISRQTDRERETDRQTYTQTDRQAICLYVCLLHEAEIHTHIHTYIHTYILTYIHTYVRTYVHTDRHTHIQNTYTDTYTPTYMHT